MRNRFAVFVAGAMTLAPVVFAQTTSGDAQATIWRFDNIHSVGGHATHVLGHPYLIDSPYGKAVEFNGNDDALFIDEHPLAGASAYTWEVIFYARCGWRAGAAVFSSFGNRSGDGQGHRQPHAV